MFLKYATKRADIFYNDVFIDIDAADRAALGALKVQNCQARMAAPQQTEAKRDRRPRQQGSCGGGDDYA